MEIKVPYPKGLWISKATATPQGYASELINLIPTLQGLKLRRGNRLIEEPFAKADYITSFIKENRVILFSRDIGISTLNENDLVENIFAGEKNIPINALETNNRLILFYENLPPKELYKEGFNWKIEGLTFSPVDTVIEFNNFSNATRYRERLYYYKKGENILYYTIPLGYKGDLRSFDVSGIFNSKGTIAFVATLGYSAGAGVQSHLVVGFNGGDILVFDGTNPESPNSWRALTAVSLGGNFTGEVVIDGTNLYALSNEGLIDIAIAIKTDSIEQAKSLTQSLKEETIDYSRMRLYRYGSYIIFGVNNLATDYLLNTEIMGFCKLQGEIIQGATELGGRFYFCDNEGKVFEGFSSENDNGEPIKARYVSSWLDLGTSNNKRSLFCNLNLLERGGAYSIYCNVSTNFNVDNLNKAVLPKQLASLIKWSDIKPNWSNVKAKLWAGARINAYQTIKFPRGGLGRTLAVAFDIEGLKVQEFIIGDATLVFDICGF